MGRGLGSCLLVDEFGSWVTHVSGEFFYCGFCCRRCDWNGLPRTRIDVSPLQISTWLLFWNFQVSQKKKRAKGNDYQAVAVNSLMTYNRCTYLTSLQGFSWVMAHFSCSKRESWSVDAPRRSGSDTRLGKEWRRRVCGDADWLKATLEEGTA